MFHIKIVVCMEKLEWLSNFCFFEASERQTVMCFKTFFFSYFSEFIYYKKYSVFLNLEFFVRF